MNYQHSGAAAKVIMFPRWTQLECIRCGDTYEVGIEYDFQQDQLCDECFQNAEALRVKRARVSHKPIGPMAVIGMGFMGAVIIVLLLAGVAGYEFVKHFATGRF